MNRLDDVRLIENAEPRCPCVLLVDTSWSMNGAPIAALNEGLHTFQADIRTDNLVASRVEIALVTFGNGGVKVTSFHHGEAELVPASGMPNEFFVEASEFQPPYLTADGDTPMGKGIHQALDLLRERKNQYVQCGRLYYRPWVFLITDGEPTDAWESAAKRIHAEDNDAAKGIAFFAVGVPPVANMEILSHIAVRKPVMLKGLGSFSPMFQWLSDSQARVSCGQVADQIALADIGGWGQL
ncbi:vWA domain-containing protein [Dictyobacter formicarum]|uniref:VWFA domain-containing protein n=1 Tax=Dictyobacter formicarum TaxID=2778368 RepID=A0ABQ3VH12_9CHLR|nr:VWA domain-containing protein [Dictyobacter formicarum]GHO85222.1 hypothetical protein KSZ_32280 [Dictyobacter formicarum]